MIGAKAPGMSGIMLVTAFYLLIVNTITFVVYGRDKYLAVNHARRISESTLLTLGLVGGSVGGFAAQRYFRHKTRKQPFQFVFWFIMAMQFAALIAIVLLASGTAPHASPSPWS
jgi:uncharacterized membrane protein YsdA (DUF1294 family)